MKKVISLFLLISLLLPAATVAQAAIPTGWQYWNNGWYYYDNQGVPITNQWRMDSRGWCYLDNEGRLKINSWQMDSIGWCYLDKTGHLATDCWQMDSDGWCYLNGAGYLTTNSWQTDTLGWCYLDDTGHLLKNGWARDSRGWCYLDDTGHVSHRVVPKFQEMGLHTCIPGKQYNYTTQTYDNGGIETVGAVSCHQLKTAPSKWTGYVEKTMRFHFRFFDKAYYDYGYTWTVGAADYYLGDFEYVDGQYCVWFNEKWCPVYTSMNQYPEVKGYSGTEVTVDLKVDVPQGYDGIVVGCRNSLFAYDSFDIYARGSSTYFWAI